MPIPNKLDDKQLRSIKVGVFFTWPVIISVILHLISSFGIDYGYCDLVQSTLMKLNFRGGYIFPDNSSCYMPGAIASMAWLYLPFLIVLCLSMPVTKRSQRSLEFDKMKVFTGLLFITAIFVMLFLLPPEAYSERRQSNMEEQLTSPVLLYGLHVLPILGLSSVWVVSTKAALSLAFNIKVKA